MKNYKKVILDGMLSQLPDNLDESNMNYYRSALEPVAKELSEFYSELDKVCDDTFVDEGVVG